MYSILKKLWWDIKRKAFWSDLLCQLLDILPGASGSSIRGLFWAKSFKACGKDFFAGKRMSVIHPDKVVMGNKVRVNINCSISAGGGVTVGDNVLIGPDVKIWSINHKFDSLDVPIMDQSWTSESVEIGNDVWLAANVVVLPGSKIPDGVIIGAGSIVIPKLIEPYTIYAGNPMKKIKKRGTPSPAA